MKAYFLITWPAWIKLDNDNISNAPLKNGEM